jgi:hypothetical protein
MDMNSSLQERRILYMKLNTLIRWAIGAQWLFGALAVIVGLIEERHLSVNLSHVVDQQPGTTWETSIVVVACLVLVCLVIASVGVLGLKPWARPMYRLVVFLGIAAMAMDTPRVSTPIATSLGEYSLLFIGITIGLLSRTQK